MQGMARHKRLAPFTVSTTPREEEAEDLPHAPENEHILEDATKSHGEYMRGSYAPKYVSRFFDSCIPGFLTSPSNSIPGSSNAITPTEEQMD